VAGQAGLLQPAGGGDPDGVVRAEPTPPLVEAVAGCVEDAGTELHEVLALHVVREVIEADTEPTQVR